MKLLFCILLISCNYLQAQNYWNDTSLLGGYASEFTTAVEVDSGVIVFGEVRELNTVRAFPVLSFFSNNSQDVRNDFVFDYEVDNFQSTSSNYSKIFINNDGNIPVAFTNCDSNFCYPRIKEYSINGDLISDVHFKTFYDTTSLSQAFNDTHLIYNKDSYHYLLFVNSTIDNSPAGGVLVLEVDHNFNYVRHNILHTVTGTLSVEEITIGNDGSISVLTNHVPGGSGINYKANLREYRLNNNLTIIEYLDFYDGQVLRLPKGWVSSNDSLKLVTYIKGFYQQNIYRYYNYLVCLDNDLNILWKIKPDEQSLVNPLFAASYHDMIRTNDDKFVILGSIYPDSLSHINRAQITKFDSLGNILWTRRHYKVKDDPLTIEGPQIEMNSIIQKKDSGFICVGRYNDYEQYELGNHFQKSYIFETNCLGFMGNPESNFTYTNNGDFNITFTNTSFRSGGYTWYFGDGDSLVTDEAVLTLTHQYNSAGVYNVTLISNGCGNIKDTVQYEVLVSHYGDDDNHFENIEYFSLVPNPVVTGGEIYVYLKEFGIGEDAPMINIYSLSGQLIRTFTLENQIGTYHIPNQLASGEYILSLIIEGEIKRTEKLVVQ